MKISRLLSAISGCSLVLVILGITSTALADAPIVTTVPGDANNPTIQHPMIIGRPITLKGAVDFDSITASYSWLPGDGSAAYTGTVGDAHWAVWAEHTYAGAAGDVFIATLTVDNGADPEVEATFVMVARADTVPNRSNTAIAEALWYMHRNQIRFDGDELGVTNLAESLIPMGSWSYPSFGGSLTVSSQGATLNAFEANGHRENGDASNPYTETVNRGMKYLFSRLMSEAIAIQTLGPLDGAAERSDNPDSNGNGIGIRSDLRSLVGVSGSIDPPYQLGMIMDAIVASGTPGAIASTGPEDVIDRSYGDIIQDMVDWYAMAQSDSAVHGGWEYRAYNNTFGSQDNSASGWAATGVVAAEDLFGSTVPDWLKTRNLNGLESTDQESDVADGDGIHGYRSASPLWGAYGTTGSGMVQMSMNGLAATTSATPDERWVRSENFFRRNFDNMAGRNPLKSYYYGMFNFSKAMRTAKPAPVTIIGTAVGAAEDPPGIGCGPSTGCGANGPQPLDWYNDSTSGLALTVTSYQATTGANIGQFAIQNATGESSQAKHVQPWGTQILTRTLAQAGPIAVGSVSPNPAGEGFVITLDHSRSFHQDPNRSLVQFEWDMDNDGTFDLMSVDASPDPALQVGPGYVCGVGGLPCSHILSLRVTDDADPPVTATDIVILDLTIPPHAPTAISGGPYRMCAGETITVDGSGSFDIDEGNSENDAEPFDTITAYEWELDGVSPFDYAEAAGVMADVTFATSGVRNIGLRVTDNSELAYPSSGDPAMNLTNTDNTQVLVADCINADLAVSISADQTNPIVPDPVTITATISNGGPDDATDVYVIANLSNLVEIDSWGAGPVVCVATGVQTATQNQYRCDIGDLASGTSVDIEVTMHSDVEAMGDFEFTVDVDLGQLLDLADPNMNNNSFSASVNWIDEIIVVVQGRGAGSFGIVEFLLLGSFAGFIAMMRRRKLRAAASGPLSVALLAVFMMASDPVNADDERGWYIGASIGTATSETSGAEFADGMSAAGYSVSSLSLDDKDSGYKVTVGFSFNKHISVQGSYVDLGKLETVFSTSVQPDDIDAMLEAGASLLPGRGRGFLTDLVIQLPVSERFALYATLGLFWAEPETSQTVIYGGSGTASRSDTDQDFAGSIGVRFKASDRLSLKLGYEQYNIDRQKTDFPTASLTYRFGAGDKGSD
jgi:opacity protein-like surface antigen